MIPRLHTVDSAPSLLQEGYAFISRRCDRLGTDAFRTRILLRPAVCMRGEEASRIFYGDGRFTRKGAMPASVQHLLQDKGSVQSLDGDAHRQRKQMFLDVLPRADSTDVREVFLRECALAVVAAHRGPEGELLDLRTAGVELLNFLRPIVAVSRFIAFAALALLQEPRWRAKFAGGEEDDLRGFVDEARRLYPFFPLITGRCAGRSPGTTTSSASMTGCCWASTAPTTIPDCGRSPRCSIPSGSTAGQATRTP
jgi:cytochrome P450